LPIFIVGTPRSGTTLLRLLLNHHPQIAIPDETNVMTWLYKSPGHPRRIVSKASDATNLPTAFGRDLAAEYDALWVGGRPRGRRAKIEWFFERFADEKEKDFWGDKTPGHAAFARDIKRLFPECTIAFMVRDPRAVVASFVRYRADPLRSQRDFWMSDTLEHAVMNYGRYIRPGIACADVLEFIRYEDLVEHPLVTLEQTCNMLRIPFASQMLEYVETSGGEFFEGASRRDGMIPEWKAAALGPIDPRLADSWRGEFTTEQIAYLNQELLPFIRGFGYTE